MNSIQAMQDFVMTAGSEVVTDSRKVAKHFGKRHDTVLRAFRNIRCSKGFAQRNFAECLEINELANGKPEPVIQMTKDGFMFLAMGFTGAAAAAMKEAFIDAFNRMAEFIQSQALSAWQRFNAKQIEFMHKRDKASHCGKGLNEWKHEKPELLIQMQRLHPQLPLLA